MCYLKNSLQVKSWKGMRLQFNTDVSFAPLGLGRFSLQTAAYAAGYILTPLRGLILGRLILSSLVLLSHLSKTSGQSISRLVIGA